jgi:NAD(P)-dependent dehydrogenase (short-subunit alcohol dehydrogenase family)
MFPAHQIRETASGEDRMRSLVVGASGGIGSALVAALSARGEVVGLSRRVDGLDVTEEASVQATLEKLEGSFDLVMIATGALEIGEHRPEKSLRHLEPAALAAQFAVNSIGPVLVLKHLVRLLPRDRQARVGVLSARVGSIEDNRLGGWYSYRAAKAALNQLVHTAAIEISRSHPQSVLACLHPGTVATPFTAAYAGSHPTVAPEVAAANLIRVLERLMPADTGSFHDWQGTEVPW